MYGGSSKLGRGGGAGAGRGTGAKRPHSSFPLPPPHRPSGPGSAGASRLSLGGRGSGSASNPRSRATGPAAAPAATEETFSLVAGNNPLAFAMIIRLAPDLVDEIRRLEAQDGTARIKFDANANNSAGNVIDVGGKEFRFTWSREFGDLCDIYEERQSGEDGNGLLVESGSAWRKLNVQRVLDESTKNHVKMMSEEAERKLKSRKAIVLDHGNPSMKSQLKALAAVETNPWRHYKQKKEPAFKKRKVEPPQVIGPPKSVHKSGISSTTTTKGRHSSSPLPSPPEPSVHPASPLGNVNIPKSNATVEDILPTQGMSKENNATSSEKEIPTLTTGVVRKRNAGAVGETIPNSGRKVEPVTKKSSNFQASGRNITKPGVELETLRKPLSESASSPEDNHHQRPVAEDKNGRTLAAEPIFNEKSTTDELEEPTHLNSKLGEDSNALEKIDIQEHSPDLFGEKKGSENSEGQVGSTSDSGSDSDSESDSSDSASDSGSRSRSRSRSIVGSGSGSSSDSESDASSNSKQGSDEDVDIMTSDDDKEPQHKLQPSETGFSNSPIPWRTPDIKPVHSGNSEKQDGQGSDAIEIEKDFPDDEQETELAAVTSSVPDKEGDKFVEETKPFSPDHEDLRGRQSYEGSLFDEGNNTLKHSVRHEQSDSSERTSIGKLKRSSDAKHFKEKVERTKRIRAEARHSVSGAWDNQLPESTHDLSPDGLDGNPYSGSTIPVTNKTDRDGNTDIGLKKGYNQAVPGKSSSDIQQSGRRSFDQSTRSKASDAADRPDKHEGLGRGHKYSEKSFNVHEGLSMQKENLHRDISNEADDAYAKKVSKNSRGGGAGGKNSVSIDSHYRKHGEMLGKSYEGGQFSSTLMGSSPKDNARAGVDVSPMFNGKGSILQRELSDLELGELREPLPEETPIKKKFERKSSFKQSENKPCSTENWNSDLSKAKSVGKATSESGKPSPPNLNVNQDGSNKKRNTEDRTEDLRRSNQRVVQSQPQHVSKVDRVEVGSKLNKLSDGSNKSRQNESKASQGIGLESYQSYCESNKKAPVTAPLQHDAKRGLVSPSPVETRTHISNAAVELTDGKRDSNWGEGNNSDRKRRDSSSDENSCSYSKYEKDEPELKGPIRDFSQYKEYVQEYRDKYDTYCSLDKILETYRNEFQKLGKDLDSAKGRDMERYYDIAGQLKESYHQCGTRHKRLKKIFVVLHEELKNLKQKIKDFALSYTKD